MIKDFFLQVLQNSCYVKQTRQLYICDLQKCVFVYFGNTCRHFSNLDASWQNLRCLQALLILNSALCKFFFVFKVKVVAIAFEGSHLGGILTKKDNVSIENVTLSNLLQRIPYTSFIIMHVKIYNLIKFIDHCSFTHFSRAILILKGFCSMISIFSIYSALFLIGCKVVVPNIPCNLCP